jgi:hypothetical protein
MDGWILFRPEALSLKGLGTLTTIHTIRPLLPRSRTTSLIVRDRSTAFDSRVMCSICRDPPPILQDSMPSVWLHRVNSSQYSGSFTALCSRGGTPREEVFVLRGRQGDRPRKGTSVLTPNSSLKFSILSVGTPGFPHNPCCSCKWEKKKLRFQCAITGQKR